MKMDKEILAKLKNGDTEAFESILSFYEKSIYGYSLRVLKNKDVALDITQETFIKLYANRKKIDSEKNLKSWLFTVATNLIYDYFRSKKRKKEISLEDEFETIEEDRAYYSKDEIVSDVEKALEKIRSDYKEPLLLFYKEGFKYEEIAEILMVPLNTVKTNISRGKEELKKFLGEYGTD